jgi:hypothetical protein
MEIIKKQLILPKNEYYVKHLSIVNVFLPRKLTPKEIEVVASFMSLEGDIANDRFGTSARRIVMQGLNLSPGGLGNYMDSLQKKGFITKQDGSYSILPILHPELEEQKYMFNLLKRT